LYRYFVSQSSEFCRHNPLCCFSTNVYYCCLFRYRLNPETFGHVVTYSHEGALLKIQVWCFYCYVFALQLNFERKISVFHVVRIFHKEEKDYDTPFKTGRERSVVG